MAESLVGASIGPHALGTAVGYLAEGTDELGYGHELQTLHAGVLGLIHPRTGEYLEVCAELPEYFLRLQNSLRNQK